MELSLLHGCCISNYYYYRLFSVQVDAARIILAASTRTGNRLISPFLVVARHRQSVHREWEDSTLALRFGNNFFHRVVGFSFSPHRNSTMWECILGGGQLRAPLYSGARNPSASLICMALPHNSKGLAALGWAGAPSASITLWMLRVLAYAGGDDVKKPQCCEKSSSQNQNRIALHLLDNIRHTMLMGIFFPPRPHRPATLHPTPEGI